ncbi:MAG: hypothetical protein M1830_002589 [Pleopsidium flavum]|nr:MAG: hypothetical protein M1830_002589 [Pleopsidium flavum]
MADYSIASPLSNGTSYTMCWKRYQIFPTCHHAGLFGTEYCTSDKKGVQHVTTISSFQDPRYPCMLCASLALTAEIERDEQAAAAKAAQAATEKAKLATARAQATTQKAQRFQQYAAGAAKAHANRKHHELVERTTAYKPNPEAAFFIPGAARWMADRNQPKPRRPRFI